MTMGNDNSEAETERDHDENPVPKQPLHPSVVARLDPEYVAFYNKYLQYMAPSHTLPWDPSSRDPPIPGSEALRTETEPLKVGKTKDYEVAKGHAMVRVYTPEGEIPEGGWPVLLFIPGGMSGVDAFRIVSSSSRWMGVWWPG